ncbi:Helicase superfamily 1/2, ATP-binding domain, partial [Fusarium oxysporum f. sp. vasinfectum]
MATIAQQHLPDSPPSNTNSDTQATGRRTDGSERGEGEGRWLLYNEEYQSLICAFHGYAVRFRNLEGHLKDRHPDLSHQVRSDLIRRHKGLLPTLLEEGPREDQLARHGSSNPAEPVEGLPIHRGFACTWPGCGYLTPSWKCLRMHFNDEHNAKAAKRKTQADLWAAVHLQTFFTGPKRAIRYFCPEDQMTIAHITKGWSLQQEEQEEMQKVMDEGILRHETTNWLKRTGWSAHFTGRNLMDIQACSKMPGRGNEGNDEVLRHMNEALDRLFFDRCIGGLKSMPLMTRLLLASPHPHDAHSRPFGPLQEKTSMDRDEGLQERILQVLAGFWTQRLDGDPFASPLWHFVGVLGIDGETGQLRPAHLFTYVLAGLVFTGRALLGEWAIPTRERDGMEDLTQRFAQVRDAWLCKATYSPMGYILSLLLFGKKIARETGSRLMVSWSKQGEMMYFMGKPILMEDLRTMVAKMTADAEDLLWGQLMFKEGNDERFVIPLAGIEDDLTQTRRGQSFIHRNGLAGKEVEMLEDLIASSRKTDLLDQTGEWKWAGIRKYLKLVKRDRNIFIIDGEVVLVTQYHKSLAHFDSPKVIPRFLPGRIGQLFVMYMIYIRPLTDRWEADKWELYGEKMAPPSDFIWHNEAAGGVPWESSQMSAAMGRWTSYYIGRRIMLQDWRHIAIAISKKHARDRGAGRADFEDSEDDHDESEQYEVPDDLAASHTGQTAANHGVTIDILKRLTAESLEIFGQQEEAVRQAAAQQSPLVAVLPTGGGKSLVFMVPAMLASAGVTIVVAPYAELKRQLVQRCVDAGLDCKPWPEARSSWPRITLVSAEAAITDDFLQWAADLSVNGRLDRIVIDECHLTFTAAETYHSKLRGLVLLRSLGCPFVFLTGTLPPLRQRDFEEAMQLQNPLYIRASSHRLNVRYAVLRVRNGRGVMEVKRRVEARLPDLSAGEKGIIYCTSQAKCKALARQLDCHYYHALRDDSDSQFIAQREEGFQAWLRGEAPYIVATAALGTGIDVA